MRALNRKLIRELWQLKGQIATIALVIASGITSFISLRGSYSSLALSCAAYYDATRFAHVFATVKRAPEALAQRIERLPGVARAETRVVQEVTLPLPGMARPAYGKLSSLPASRTPTLNALSLSKGRYPERGHDEEVLLLKAFADANGVELGQRLPTVVNGKLRQLRVVGVATSPEYVYALRPGAIVDDPRRYAVVWMDRGALAEAFQMQGAFNDVSLRLQPGSSQAATITALETLLAPYGSDGARDRAHQTSNRILMTELDQLAVLANMVPLVFLAVAAFLVNLVLGRLIRLQRHELATLKAVGYSNAEIGWHYLGIVAIVMLPGLALGVVGGEWLGKALMRLYGAVFRLPTLAFSLTADVVLIALAVSTLSAALGALLAVRAAITLPPAEAMRPPAPARYRRGIRESLGVATLLGPTAMMVLREVLRRPLRTLLSSFGIAGAVALLILGHFGWDSVTYYFETLFDREQRQDISVVFREPVAPRAASELRRLPGVVSAEGLRAVPVRARFDQHLREAVLLGLPEHASLRRLLTRSGDAQELPRDGVLVTKTLGELLGLRVGDRIELEPRQGERRLVRPVVTAFLDESNGLQIYAPEQLVSSLSGDLGAVSSVLLRVDPNAIDGVERRLRRSPAVLDIADAHGDAQRMREMNASFIDVWTMVSIVLSASVIFGVNYNNARIALAARSRDLASLRVLGYSRREVGNILLGSLAVEVGIAIPLGLWLGRVWSEWFMTMSIDPETFRWSVHIEPSTYLLATSVALLSALASALWVQRSLGRLDLIAVLKTRE